MKRNIQPFWDTYVTITEKMKCSIYTYVSPQESYIGRTAKKTVCHQKGKNTCVIQEKQFIHVQSQRMNNITRA